MSKERYTITDKDGKSVIAEKEDSRYISIDEFAQHIAMDIVDDYREMSIKVLTAISPVIKAFRSNLGYGMDC